MSVPEPPITTSPDRLGGTPVFAGTRVPVRTLIDYLEGGDTIETFLDDFPSVTRDHAIAVLEVAKSALIAKAVAARAGHAAMRVPLDSCVPKGLRASLTAHDVQTASEMGWGDLDNGALLDAMTGRLDALVTVDRRLPQQQRIGERSFAVVVLRANSNRLAGLLPLVPEVLEALSDLDADTATEVGG